MLTQENYTESLIFFIVEYHIKLFSCFFSFLPPNTIEKRKG